MTQAQLPRLLALLARLARQLLALLLQLLAQPLARPLASFDNEQRLQRGGPRAASLVLGLCDPHMEIVERLDQLVQFGADLIELS